MEKAFVGLIQVTAAEQRVARLAGHVLPALQRATELPARLYAAGPGIVADAMPPAGESALTLTVILRRSDPQGFERFLREVQDRRSPNFLRFLSQEDLTRRFGPAQQAYDELRSYLEGHGFTLVEGSANRLTLTVRGTRAQAEQAFAVAIRDYRLGGQSFFANAHDPALPAAIARYVQAVIGLSNFARPKPLGAVGRREEVHTHRGILPRSSRSALAGLAGAPTPWKAATGAGQIIGLLQFATFDLRDVEDYLALRGLPATRIDQLSQVHVNGGAPPGSDHSEVLLDIAAVMELAPGAAYVVYDAPFTGAGTSFQTLFNRMINDGMTVISNSWGYCESQTTLADVQSIDSILASAAASGIGVFNASGDTGSTCLDGSSDTIVVPASSPNATAVGGSSRRLGPASTYAGETWWDDEAGSGGFGVSRFFARPAYQDGHASSPMRSIPDVVANADPARGFLLCQRNAGGCPDGRLYGGTSVAAPTWAAFAARLNHAQGMNLGHLNPLLYPLAGTSVFHSPASMGSDFEHVGLGSPNLDRLNLALLGQSPGPVSKADSRVMATPPFARADGMFEGAVVVRLRDADGNDVIGKVVTLSASPAGNVSISPASGISNEANGVVVFKVKNAATESVTFTATDVTDGIVLDEKPVVTFLTPPAKAGGIFGSPTMVLADGMASSTITVTLQDVLGRGTPGKVVALSQGGGRSMVSGPTPAVTDTNGQVTFTVTNLFAETVTYTAVDVTDGNLAVPGSAMVSFVNATAQNCNPGEPAPAPGYAVTSFATGFAFDPVSCQGVGGMAFDPAGNLYAINAFDGHLYRFGQAGGTASVGTRVTTTPLPSFPIGLAFSKDGQRLYVSRHFGGLGGDIVEVSPADGHIIRTVAAGLNCALGLATDPISGDLFASQACAPPSGSDNITRIANPESATPALSVYASPGHTSFLNFGADGTLWTSALRFDLAELRRVKIAPTNAPTPGQMTILTQTAGILPSEPLLPAFKPAAPGNPSFLLTTRGPGNVDKVDLTQSPPAVSSVAAGGSTPGFLVAGPEGCPYVAMGDRIVRISRSDGSCDFAPSSPVPMLSLSPAEVLPDPAQGTPQTFTARLFNAMPDPDTRVTFLVTGANPTIKQVPLNGDGTASFDHVAANTGTDAVIATTMLGMTTLTSNTARVNWTAGKHVTFLTLNPSPRTGMTGSPVTVKASLADVSVDPPVRVSGVAVHFDLAGETCMGITDGDGLSACDLTPPAGAGSRTLMASFAGDQRFTPAETAVNFLVADAVPVTKRCEGDATSLQAGQRIRCTITLSAEVPAGTTVEDTVVAPARVRARCARGMPGVGLTCVGGTGRSTVRAVCPAGGGACPAGSSFSVELRGRNGGAILEEITITPPGGSPQTFVVSPSGGE